jgi:methionyl-tRNA synthetase
LASTAIFSTDGCFTRYNADLANGLGNLLQRALVMVHKPKYFDRASSTKPSTGLKSELPARLEQIAADYETLNFSGVLSGIWEVVARANKLIEDEKPWAKVKENRLDEVAELLHRTARHVALGLRVRGSRDAAQRAANLGRAGNHG